MSSSTLPDFERDLLAERRHAKEFRDLAHVLLGLSHAGETHAERAASLLSAKGSYAAAFQSLQAAQAGVLFEIGMLALHVRLEAHERGLINANDKKDQK